MRHVRLAAAAAAFAIAAAGSAFAQSGEPGSPSAKIEKIEAHLFYEYTGRLSANVAPPAEFSFWNTVIGEGSAEEAANDVLITITISAEPGSYFDTDVLNITVLNTDDKSVVLERSITGLLIPMSGSTTKAVYVMDTTCRSLEVVATIGASTLSNTIPFACGE